MRIRQKKSGETFAVLNNYATKEDKTLAYPIG